MGSWPSSPLPGRRRGARKRLVLGVIAALGVGLLAAPTAAAAPVRTLTATPAPGDPAGSEFVSLQGRLMDTRATTGQYTTPMPAGGWRNIQATGQLGIPASGVVAVQASVTEVSSTMVDGAISIAPASDTSKSYKAVYYGGEVAAANISNAAIISLDTTGKFSIKADSTINVIVDIQGYYLQTSTPSSATYWAVQPQRIVDTRAPAGVPTAAQYGGGQILTTNALADQYVAADATAVFANVTIINATTGNGFIGPLQADGTSGNISLNYGGDYTAFGVPLQIGANGNISIRVQGPSVHVVIDIVGYFASGSAGGFTPGNGKLLDRSSSTPMASNEQIAIKAEGMLGIPANATAVVVNVTTINDSTSDNRISAWAVDQINNGTSVAQAPSGLSRSNTAVIGLGIDGRFNLKNIGSGAVSVVLQLEGWYTNPMIEFDMNNRDAVTALETASAADPDFAAIAQPYLNQFRADQAANRSPSIVGIDDDPFQGASDPVMQFPPYVAGGPQSADDPNRGPGETNADTTDEPYLAQWLVPSGATAQMVSQTPEGGDSITATGGIDGRAPNSFRVDGNKISGGRYWNNMTLDVFRLRCRSGDCGITDRYTVRIRVNPGAKTSMLSVNKVYFPDNGNFKGAHLHLWNILTGGHITGHGDTGGLGANPNIFYFDAPFSFRGLGVTTAVTLWVRRLNNSYSADGAKTGEAKCNQSNNTCKYP